MNLTADQLDRFLLWPAYAGYFLLVVWGLSGVDYRELARRRYRQHVLYAVSVAVMLLWAMRTGVQPGLGLHLLGMTVLTLVAGWRMALLGAVFPVAGATVLGQEPWQAAGLAALLMAALPIGVTHAVWRASERLLPSNAFVYIFVCAFFGSALATTVAHLATAGLMVLTGAHALSVVVRDYLAFLPLILFPEALINGGLISILVAYRPKWVATFSTQRYFGGFNGVG